MINAFVSRLHRSEADKTRVIGEFQDDRLTKWRTRHDSNV
jgi:hypothetical protein